MRSVRRSLCAAALLLLAGGLSRAESSGPRRRLEVVEAAVPALLPAGGVVEVPVALRNRGDDTWSPAAGYAFSYHWLAVDGRVITRDGVRTALPGPVRPGDAVRLAARLEVPARPGRYLLQWDVVQEHVCWLSDRDPTPPKPVAVEVRPSHAFTVLDQAAPAWLWAGTKATVRMTLRNDGLVTWEAEGPFRLSNHWFSASGEVVTWDGPRTALPASVPPGGTVTVEGVVVAPPRGGRYLLQWDLVQEGECWFAQRDPSPEPRRPVRVLPAPAWGPVALAGASVLLILAVAWCSRGSGRMALAPLLAPADACWVGASLALKQAVVLREAGQDPGAGFAWLVAAGAVAVVALLLLLPRRVRPPVGWAVAAAGALVLLADVVYLRYFGDILSVAALAAAGQTTEVQASVWSLLEWRDLWLVADLLPGLVLVAVVGRLAREAQLRGTRLMALALVPVALLVAAVGWRRSQPEAVALRQVFRNVFVAREVGVLNFHLLDVGRSGARRLLRRPATAEEVERLAAWFRERAPRRAGTGPTFARARGRNLLMLQVESLQEFVVGYRVNGQEVTPTLDRLATDSLHFTAVADQSDQGRSSDAELATQVSLLPLPSGAAAFLHANNDFTGLAEVLAEHGYRCLSAVPFEGSFWNRRATHPAYGFTRSLFDREFAPGEVIGWGLNDRAFLGQMLPRLEALEQPFCAYLITLSLHHPFAGFPDHLKELQVGRWEGTPFGNYLHTMHFFDHALADLVAGLERSGLAEETVLAIWGDHDAGLGWDQAMAEAIGIRWHEPDWYLTDRVPLVVRVPGAPELRGSVAVPAGQTDVAPTLLALLGIDPAPYAFVGRNLLGEPGSGPVPGANDSCVDGQHLFVPRGATLAEGHCYDLANLELVAPEACRAEYQEAVREAEVSRAVLENDLQQRLHGVLAGEGAGR